MITSLKRILKATAITVGLTISAFAGPSQPPAGNYITNISTNNSNQIFRVSSGTITGCLRFGDNSSQCTAGGGGGSPGAPDGSLQYNHANSLSGAAGSVVTASSISYTGVIQASTFTSNSHLFNGSSSGIVTIKPQATAGTWTLQLPANAGSSSQFLQTDGTGVSSWQTVTGGGGSSALAIQKNATNISSPTVAINFVGPPFNVSLVNGSTSQVTLDGSSVTLQGNNVISLGSTLQPGATFFVSSATVNGQLTVNGLTASMPVQTGANDQLTSAAINLSGSQVSSVLAPSHGGTGISSPSNNNIIIGNLTGSYATVPVPNCSATSGGLAYDNVGQAFSCNPLIQNTGTLQSGATFYVSSGTVFGPLNLGNSLHFGQGSTGGLNSYNIFYDDTGTFNKASFGWTNSGVFNWQEGGSNQMTLGNTGLIVSSITVSSMTFNGSGNGQISLSIAGSSNTVITSSAASIVGSYLVYTSTNYQVGTSTGTTGGGGGAVTPGGSSTQIQYNNGGSFAGSNLFQFNGTSVTVQSSMTVGNFPSANTSAALDVFRNTSVTDTALFAVGSTANSNQFVVRNQDTVLMSASGANIGNLQIGGRADGDAIGDPYSLTEIPNTSGTQGVKMYDASGNLDIGTARTGSGGTNGSINFNIAGGGLGNGTGTNEVVISSLGVTISTAVVITSSVTVGNSTFGNFVIGPNTYGALNLTGSPITSSTYTMITSPSDTNLYINRPLGANIQFRENNSDSVYFKSGGNVGIGNTSAAYKLDVTGVVNASVGVRASSITLTSLLSQGCIGTGSDGTFQAGSCSGGGASLSSTNTWTGGQTFVSSVTITTMTTIATSAGAQGALNGILNLTSTNAAWNEPHIYIQNTANTSNNNSDILVDDTFTPAITIRETSQSNPSSKKWQYSAHNGVLRFENRLDDDSAFIPFMQVSSKTFYNDIYIGPTYGNQSNFTQLGIQSSTGNVYALTITTSTSNTSPYLLTLSTSGVLAVPATSNIASLGGYGGPQGNSTLIMSSAVVACQEWVQPTAQNVSSATFRQSTSFSSHSATGFYDSNCNKIVQSTASINNGANTTLFKVPFALQANTKYFLCTAVDANAVQMTSTAADFSSIYSVLANDGEPATNYHVFTTANASTTGAGPVVILPSSCGTRSNYSPGSVSTIGYAIH